MQSFECQRVAEPVPVPQSRQPRSTTPQQHSLPKHFVHGDRYGYSKVSYTRSQDQVENVASMHDVARYRYMACEFKEALAWLVSVEKKCLGDADFHYLFARCHAALGDLEQVRRSLLKVSVLSETLRLRALEDPAFESIYGAEPHIETI